MKRAKSRKKSQHQAGVSLFPFLAVLMCTMGALVVLLVVINRQARLQAAESAHGSQGKGAQKDELEAARELVQLQISQLKTSRDKTEEQLSEARLQLGHLEDHMRRLRDQLASLRAAGAELDSLKNSTTQQRQELQAELERVQAAVADAQKRLAEAQKEARQKSKSFAIIPYEGPNSTHRRPIYLECTEDAVILQPEGIRFTDADFDGPLGPGNPLDAALRASREYLQSQHAVASDGSDEPYPLLLVRPRGITAYYAARAALKSWASEFGYELIGEDWQLAFPKADPRLAALVRKTADGARMRQQRLAEVAPRFYGNESSSPGSSRPVYRAAPSKGGLIVDGEEPSSEASPAPQRARAARAFGGQTGSPSAGEASGSSVAGGMSGAEASGGATNLSASGGVSGSSSQAGGLAEREGVVRKPDSQDQLLPRPPDQAATAQRPGEWVPYERPPKLTPSEQKKAEEEQAERDKRNDSQRDPTVRSLAETRGANWGLRDAAPRSMPITRPIRVECYADRIVVSPERGRDEGKEIPMRGKTRDSVDDVVSAVWGRMDSWGIAGRSMYWKPVLKVDVAPGGQDRFQDLQALLKGSGLEVQQSDR